ncbi:bifunctional adenosylcobinamide kinase/adenosylcobinamide-phosphate guanylyltransferase [Patescibacteria group bacterium]|nr:bifunctional adenosylcobinamide kinase/adenosylcobinamide-phosphate guanylyltransferase [Patescibacteria group bacterium]
MYLLGGEPGIGKSTIALQIVQQLNGQRIAYFSGEEQSDQIVDRQSRITENTQNENMDIFHANRLEDILLTAETGQYEIIIVDSIQTISSENLEGASGSPAQVKYCAEKIAELCKKNNITALIIGHVTK